MLQEKWGTGKATFTDKVARITSIALVCQTQALGPLASSADCNRRQTSIGMVRVKRRHLAVKIVPHDLDVHHLAPIPLEEREIFLALKSALQTLHGDFGLGSCIRSLVVKKYCPTLRIAIVSIQRGPHLLLTSSLPLIKKIADVECSLKLDYFSGTLRSSYKALLKKTPKIPTVKKDKPIPKSSKKSNKK